jgi:hypothetical protein
VKNDTPALSAPEFIAISQLESPEGGDLPRFMILWVLEWRGFD